MAYTNAEIQRRWREREKAKRAAGLKAPDTAQLDVMRTPFFSSDWLTGNWSDIELELDAVGLEAAPFEDDRGAASVSGIIEDTHLNEPHLGPAYAHAPQNSLGRAEVMIGGLISAAEQLALVVNNYKRAEIEARMAELEQADLTDAAAKKQAFADMERLHKLKNQLLKQVRWTFPQWKLRGE